MENQNQELVLMVEQVEALKQAKPFVELMMYNRCAIREIETKLRVLDEEFSILADRNPIQTIKSRGGCQGLSGSNGRKYERASDRHCRGESYLLFC